LIFLRTSSQNCIKLFQKKRFLINGSNLPLQTHQQEQHISSHAKLKRQDFHQLKVYKNSTDHHSSPTTAFLSLKMKFLANLTLILSNCLAYACLQLEAAYDARSADKGGKGLFAAALWDDTDGLVCGYNKVVDAKGLDALPFTCIPDHSAWISGDLETLTYQVLSDDYMFESKWTADGDGFRKWSEYWFC
jgi:hypothetical protein